MKALIEFFTKQSLFGILLSIFTIFVGIAAVFLIRREVFPNVSYDMITVLTAFPGSSPQEVERLVTNPLEQEIREVDGIKRIESHSVESQSTLIIWLDPDQTTEEQAKSDVRDIVDRVKPKLPDGSEEPLISSLESKQQPIIEVAVAGDIPDLELRQIAKDLKDELEDVDGVARVSPVGLRDLEIRVETNKRLLQRYQLSIDDVINSLKLQNVSIPGGVIESPKEAAIPERIVRTGRLFETDEDVANTVIRANDLGKAIRVKDVAKVTYDLARVSVIDHTNAKRSVRLTVLKKEKADGIQVVDSVKELVAKLSPSIDERVSLEYINDASFFIRRRLNILSTNLAVGLVLVAVLLSLLLPVKVALIVSVGIPFSFFGTMILFNSWGRSINLISMIGLIIVSGMLVDDAIVVTDNCVRKLEEGLSPIKAAILGATEIWMPVTASVMTTVVVFVPMLFMSGLFGKFVREIPIGVIAALLISLIEAFFILPGHIAKWVKVPPRKAGEETAIKSGRFSTFWKQVIEPSYLKAVAFNIRNRYWVGLASVLIIAGTLLYAATGMRFILFPPDDVEIFMIRTQAPTGSSLETTERLVKPLEVAVSALPKSEMKNFLTTIGLHNDGPQISRRGPEYAQLTVYLTSPSERVRGDAAIIEELRKKIGNAEGLSEITFERVNPGPPVGKPIDIGVRAKEYADILPAVKELKSILEKLGGVTDIEDSYVLGKKELRVEVKGAEAAAAQVSAAGIGNTVRASFEGIVATSLRTLDEEVDVRVSLSKEERADNDTLTRLNVPNVRQNLIPLSQVSEISESQGLAEYEHEDYERQVKVTAAVDTTTMTARKANGIIKEKIPELEKQFPGVSFAFGGEDQDTQESMASLGRAFVVALLGVFLILVLNFRNLLHPLLVFVTIPFGVVAVIWAFVLHGKPLTFMGMLGIVALAGVIVNNSIVFIDFTNQRREQGESLFDSILNAAKSRLRPIFLTTMTTTVGLIPTTYGIGGLDRFVVYITMALSWGLLLGSGMVSLFLPAAIAISDDLAGFFRKYFSKSEGISEA